MQRPESFCLKVVTGGTQPSQPSASDGTQPGAHGTQPSDTRGSASSTDEPMSVPLTYAAEGSMVDEVIGGQVDGDEQVLVLASEQTVADLCSFERPSEMMMCEFKNGQFKFTGGEFDVGAPMMEAMQNGIILHVKKFKAVPGGPWLYDICPTDEYAEAFMDSMKDVRAICVARAEDAAWLGV